MVRLVKSRPRKNQSERLVLTQDYANMQIRQFISSLSAEKCLSVNLVTSVLGPFDLVSFAEVLINRHALFQDCVTNAGNVCPVTCLHQAFFLFSKILFSSASVSLCSGLHSSSCRCSSNLLIHESLLFLVSSTKPIYFLLINCKNVSLLISSNLVTFTNNI